jgi:hypothetical protein
MYDDGMTITLEPALEAALAEAARQQGTTPDALASRILREQLPVKSSPIEPQDEWERRLFGAARNYGVSLSDEALSRESIYD